MEQRTAAPESRSRRRMSEARERWDAGGAPDRVGLDLDDHGRRGFHLCRLPVRDVRAAAAPGDRAHPHEDDAATRSLLAVGAEDLRAARRRVSGGHPRPWSRARAGAHRDVREVREPRLSRVLARDPAAHGRRSDRRHGAAHLAEVPRLHRAVSRIPGREGPGVGAHVSRKDWKP
jgi:hypothetical protein